MEDGFKSASPTGPVGEAGSLGGTLALPNYSTKLGPEEARAAFEAYLAALPKELQDKYRRFDLHQLTEQLEKGDNPAIEGLLQKLETIDSATILSKVYPPVPWIVPDYLPPGLTILSGRPKVGKSWLGLQLALSVITGGKMMGKDVPKGKVLYLALEDSERRLKDRMQKQGWPGDPKVDFILQEAFHKQIGFLNSGGGKRLLKHIKTGRYRLVIVDTFSRAIFGDQLKSDEMTTAVAPLQESALKLDISLVLIDHMKKALGVEVDPIGDVFGSVAKAGILDTSWAIYKEHNKYGAKLAITGRETAEYTLKLNFDAQNFYWHLEGDVYELEITQKRSEILAVLEDIQPAMLTKIAEAVGQDPSNCQKRLADLCNSNLVIRTKIGDKVLYSLAGK